MSTKPSIQRVRTTYAFIKAHRTRFSVQSMCRELGVVQSGYYRWLKQPISPHDQEDARLLRVIRVNHLEPSMSRKGNCWDNAVAEAFFGSEAHRDLRRLLAAVVNSTLMAGENLTVGSAPSCRR